MKSHDLGQFLFNSNILNEIQIREIIKKSKVSIPTLATEALFLRLVSANELTGDDSDEIIKNLLLPRQVARAEELKDGQSLWMAQGLIDNGIANFYKLERILEKFHELEIPPLESVITDYYEVLKTQSTVDFPLAIDIVCVLHAFLSEILHSSIIILPPSQPPKRDRIGASVKITGEVPAVIGIFATEEILFKLSKRYDSIVEEPTDSYDAISELLNVFTGQFTVKIAATRGLEEEPEPPRYGSVEKEVHSITILSDIGKFYIYIDKSELFDA